MTAAPDGEPRWQIEETDGFDAEREAAFLYVLRVSGPDYAGRWLTALNAAIAALAEFPGPRSHPIDEALTQQFSREIRRKLFYGPSHRRQGTARYRILFHVQDPPADGNAGIIFILRLRHGASADTQPETPGEPE